MTKNCFVQPTISSDSSIIKLITKHHCKLGVSFSLFKFFFQSRKFFFPKKCMYQLCWFRIVSSDKFINATLTVKKMQTKVNKTKTNSFKTTQIREKIYSKPKNYQENKGKSMTRVQMLKREQRIEYVLKWDLTFGNVFWWRS